MPKQLLKAINSADIDAAAATTHFTMEAPWAGKLSINECYLRWSEATGTQATTQGVISVEVAGVEVATLTANISDAVGETQKFTAASENFIEFSAGDDIVIKTKTQAAGGTTTGNGDVFLSLEWGV